MEMIKTLVKEDICIGMSGLQSSRFNSPDKVILVRMRPSALKLNWLNWVFNKSELSRLTLLIQTKYRTEYTQNVYWKLETIYSYFLSVLDST